MALMITNGRTDVLVPTKRTSRVIDRFPQYRLIRFGTHSARRRILGRLSCRGVQTRRTIEECALRYDYFESLTCKGYDSKKLRTRRKHRSDILGDRIGESSSSSKCVATRRVPFNCTRRERVLRNRRT